MLCCFALSCLFILCSFIFFLYIHIQQRRTYDRRTSGERLRGAVAVLGRSTLRQLGETEFSDDEDKADEEDEEDETSFAVGDIVAAVEESSTRQSPRVLLGKILRINFTKREVLLAHMAPHTDEEGGKCYRLVVGRDTWSESFAALVFPVDVEFSRRHQVYRLRTDPLDIHLMVKPTP